MDQRRQARYDRIYRQLRTLIEGRSPNCIAAMATICAVLHAKMPHHSWTGFYLVIGEDELHVGPYQGAVACQVLKGRGVCVHAVKSNAPVVVPDVDAFPGHIACDARSRSELVVPLRRRGTDSIFAVLDIDSSQPGVFGEADIAPLERIVALLDPFIEAGG